MRVAPGWRGRAVRVVIAAALGAGIVACDRTDAADPPDRPDSEAASPGIQPGLAWGALVGGSGVSLTLSGPDGAPLLRLACTRDPDLVTLVVESFEAVGSEERLSFGIDDEPFLFVADPGADRPSGVEGEAPLSDDFLIRLEGARSISAVYGAQTLGPHMPPDPEATRLFVSGCRQILR